MIGVYQIFIEDNCYWGSSVNCEKRCAAHLRDLKLGNHINKKMQRIFNKYKTFDWQIIVACDDRDVAYLYEQDYIDTHFGLDKCMNLSPLVTRPAGTKGLKHTDETREKLSAAATGRKHTAETLVKMSATRTGRKHSDEVKVKMSAAQTGKKRGPYKKNNLKKLE